MSRTTRIILATGVALAVVVPALGGVASAAPLQSAPAAETTTPETTVTVKDGDSIFGLAWRHGVRLSALLRANSLELTSVIHPGDTMVIPAGATRPARSGSSSPQQPSQPAGGAASPSSTNANDNATGTDYIIEAGDALASIAWRHGVGLGALVRANGISVTSLILPGQRLQIPPATRPIPTSTRSTTTVAEAAPAVAPTPTSAPVPAESSSLQTLLTYVTAQVGAPYRFFSAGPESFDCSGLVVAGFKQVGMSVPHQSRALARLGSSVDWTSESIAAGDLVFTSSTNDPDKITHVGIALDSRRWVHAVGFGRNVSIGSLPSDAKIMAVQRIELR